jgi:hypothetical protein
MSLVIRIQLHLTEAQDRKLRALALKQGTVRAELIRRGIDLLLQHDSRETDALLDLVGAAGPAGRSDVSRNHDAILYVADEPRTPYSPKRRPPGSGGPRGRKR